MIPLAALDHEFGRILVYETKRSGARVYLQGGCFQTKTDRNGISLVAYIHALCDFLIQAGSRNVLMVGCGGGSLAAMLSKSGVEITVVDVNPASIDLARNFFHLPANIKCLVADGAEHLARTATHYDAIVMDAFCGDSIPTHLRSREFLQAVRAHFGDAGGLLLANVHVIDDSDTAAIDYAVTARSVWPAVRLLDAPRSSYRNAIIAAGDVNRLKAPIVRMTPETEVEEIAAELALLRFAPEELYETCPPGAIGRLYGKTRPPR